MCASGKKRALLARHVRNRRLYRAVDRWAFCALSTSPGARQFYNQRRAAEDTHHQALRASGNRLVGILHGCLRHHTLYDEHIAWAHRTPAAAWRLTTVGCLELVVRTTLAPREHHELPHQTPGPVEHWGTENIALDHPRSTAVAHSTSNGIVTSSDVPSPA